MSTTALIPARGGSRGLPWKNLAEVGGRSLVERAIETAKEVPAIDRIVVSSEADEILDLAERCGAMPLRRPDELARDDAQMRDVVRHYIDGDPDVSMLVLLQPTSPLRSSSDVIRCLEALSHAPSAVTIAPVEHPIEWLFRMDTNGGLEPVFGWDHLVGRRQEAEIIYLLNGAVFAVRGEHLRAGGWFTDPGAVGVVMPRRRSIDIDDVVDLSLVRVLDATPDSPDLYG